MLIVVLIGIAVGLVLGWGCSELMWRGYDTPALLIPPIIGFAFGVACSDVLHIPGIQALLGACVGVLSAIYVVLLRG